MLLRFLYGGAWRWAYLLMFGVEQVGVLLGIFEGGSVENMVKDCPPCMPNT